MRVSDVAKRFGQNLSYYHRKSGLSQEALAGLSEVHRTRVGKLLHGEQLPRLDTVVKLAGALDVSVGDLVEGIAFQPAAQTGEFLFSPPKHEAGSKRKPARKRKS